MSLYINTQTNAYPLYEGDIRLLYPEMEDTFVLPDGYAVVEEGVIPQTEIGKCFDESLPVLTDSGIYQRVFIERDLTEEELSYNAAMRAQYENAIPSAPEL